MIFEGYLFLCEGIFDKSLGDFILESLEIVRCEGALCSPIEKFPAEIGLFEWMRKVNFNFIFWFMSFWILVDLIADL